MPRNGSRRLIQPRISGVVREGRHAGLLPEISQKIDDLAKAYGVSPSWVQATILGDALRVKEQPDYREARKLRKDVD